MRLVHLTASGFYGGPERQLLGLTGALPPAFTTTLATFAERGNSTAFTGMAASLGFDAATLPHDTPHLKAAIRDIVSIIRSRRADVLLTHGYKANLLGRVAARRAGVPVVGVSRGWTAENAKVRAYTAVDRWHLRCLDHVVAVSDGQAAKVRRAGVPRSRLSVIRNSARLDAFAAPDPRGRAELLTHFAHPDRIETAIVSAGRFSPEKGFDVLLNAAVRVLREHPAAGLAVFGDGDGRAKLEAIVGAAGLQERIVLPGFTADLDRLLPGADLIALASHSEGLPNVLLEAAAAGVPAVATAVGGVPEVVADGQTGLLVPANDMPALAAALARLIGDPGLRRQLGDAARRKMHAEFTFAAQAAAYAELLPKVVRRARTPAGAA